MSNNFYISQKQGSCLFRIHISFMEAKNFHFNMLYIYCQNLERPNSYAYPKVFCSENSLHQQQTKRDGHFGLTFSEKDEFGLMNLEIVEIVHKLQKLGKLDCLQLLHFHIGLRSHVLKFLITVWENQCIYTISWLRLVWILISFTLEEVLVVNMKCIACHVYCLRLWLC